MPRRMSIVHSGIGSQSWKRDASADTFFSAALCSCGRVGLDLLRISRESFLQGPTRFHMEPGTGVTGPSCPSVSRLSLSQRTLTGKPKDTFDSKPCGAWPASPLVCNRGSSPGSAHPSKLIGIPVAGSVLHCQQWWVISNRRSCDGCCLRWLGLHY